MISSMTGYGCAEGEINGIGCTVELRSVNSRYFNARIRLPEMLFFLEQEIENLLKGSFSRGTINCVIRLTNSPSQGLFEVDERALKRYFQILRRLSTSFKINDRIDIGGLLAVPGVIVPEDIDQNKTRRIRRAILGIVRKAIFQLKQMRGAEGSALSSDLAKQCKSISAALGKIRSKSRTSLKGYHKKLQQKVNEMLRETGHSLDEATIVREVAVCAERADISEEITRLESHLQRFRQSLRSANQAGRRLDFISQEMLREANTIASKATDIGIINEVLEIKCYIDRIKEQVQNIE